MPQEHPAEFLRALLDASPVGVFVLDNAGRVRLWSSGAQRILGWPEEDVIGNALPFKPELHIRPDQQAELCLVRSDGAPIDVEMRTVAWEGGILAILTDISGQRLAQREIRDLTEREQAARAQAQADRRFRELLEAAPDAIIEVDQEGRIVLMNRVTEKTFGYTRHELLGQSVDVLLPDQLRGSHAGHRARFEADPVTRPMGMGMVLYGRRKDGSSVPVEISLSPVKSKEGFRATAIIRDVTERALIEDRLRVLREEYTRELELRHGEIERANRMKSEFMANMSHELRTPLHTVIGFSELLGEQVKGPLNADQQRFVNHIHKDAQHLLVLINEILDLSRIEAGKLLLNRDVLELGCLIEDALSPFRPQFVSKSMEVAVHSPGPVNVEGDRIRIRQIVVNLLSNALKFTAAGGRVCIGVEAADGFARVSVSDTGIGIPPAQHEAIFDKFHQIEPAMSGIREGTGLGLAITKRLVEAQGGRIWLESEPGRGQPVHVYAPFEQSSSGRRMTRVLIADDKETSRELIRTVLESLGHEVREASDGREAVREAREAPPDLIILDLQMPVLDGFGALAELRGDQSLAGTPIMALTASALQGDRERALAAGFDSYVSKPIPLRMLREEVTRLLERPGNRN